MADHDDRNSGKPDAWQPPDDVPSDPWARDLPGPRSIRAVVAMLAGEALLMFGALALPEAGVSSTSLRDGISAVPLGIGAALFLYAVHHVVRVDRRSIWACVGLAITLALPASTLAGTGCACLFVVMR